MESAMETIEHLQNQVDRVLHDTSQPWEPYFGKLESKTGVSRAYFFWGALAFVAISISVGFAAPLITNLIGLVYPVYISIRNIETSSKADDTKWLIYWVIFACINTAEYFTYLLYCWIPLYWLVKCAFLVWCMYPIENNGSKVIYNRVIKPYFLRYSAKNE